MTDRQRQRETETDRQTDREKETQTPREREREGDRDRDRDTERHRETQRTKQGLTKEPKKPPNKNIMGGCDRNNSPRETGQTHTDTDKSITIIT